MNKNPAGIIDDLRLLEAPGRVWLELWLGLAAVALTGILIWRLWRRPRRKAPLSASEVQAAQEDAMAELERLHLRIGKEHCRHYAIAVSGIVRRYIERRFDIHAPFRTTEEFLTEARVSPQLPEEHQERLRRFLICCDFLKFARGLAALDEMELLHQAAVKFVGRTSLPAEAGQVHPAEAADVHAPAAPHLTHLPTHVGGRVPVEEPAADAPAAAQPQSGGGTK